MAENKTKPTAESAESFLAKVPDAAKRADAQAIVEMMERATGETATMWGPSIVGFGQYHYTYDSGRQGDMPIVGFSPRKAATVFYLNSGAPGREELLARLGKHTTGKGCLYIKKLADVDREVLERLIVESVAATRGKQRIGG
jgi:Domain of unknown function (DU1801)